MRVSIMSRLFFVNLFILSILSSTTMAQDVSVESKWGVGLSAGYLLPMGKLSDRFIGVPKITLKGSYLQKNITIEGEFFHSNFSSGKIEDMKFQWVYNGKYYPSPKASSQLKFLGALVNLKFPTGLNWSGLSAYWSLGLGFTFSEHQIENLVYPGQLTTTLNTEFTYSPDVEKRTALHSSMGVGLNYFVSPEMYLGLSCKYNLIASILRPMEAWKLEKVSPLHLFEIGLEFIYYFTK